MFVIKTKMKKFFKYLIIVLLVIAVVLTIIGLAASKTYNFTRTLWIKADRKTVWAQVATFEAAKKWSPWESQDTTMTIKMEGQDGTNGARRSWDSKKMGKGSMTNTAVKEMEMRSYQIHFIDFNNTADGKIALADSGEGTKVSWSMAGENGFIGRIFMFFMGGAEGAIGKDFDKGLALLKSICETKKPEDNFKLSEITQKKFNKTVFVEIRKKMAMDEYKKDASSIMAGFAGRLIQFISVNKLQQKGTLFAIYYLWDEAAKKTDFSVAIPVDREVKTADLEIKYATINEGNYATIDFWGNYDLTENAHMAMDKWLKDNKKVSKGPVLEEYITDPMTEKDPKKWLTRIWYPL
jgi:effector-binding domain-containing protein